MSFNDIQRNALFGFTERLNRSKQFSDDKAVRALKKGIWLYLILLIIEGALRKWVFPGLSNPLLIVRDPVALWLIYKCWQKRWLPSNSILVITAIIGFVSILTTLIWGHGNVVVALFGARLLLVHFPVIFVIAKVFTREDVIKMGKWLLWVSIPMTFLIAIQFYSPQSAWVNRGIGGDLAGGDFPELMVFFVRLQHFRLLQELFCFMD